MGFAARFVLALLAPLLGAALGGVAGLLGGLGWTELAGTSSFEGYSGYVVVAWMLGGAVIGLIGAPLLLFRWIQRQDRARRGS